LTPFQQALTCNLAFTTTYSSKETNCGVPLALVQVLGLPPGKLKPKGGMR